MIIPAIIRRKYDNEFPTIQANTKRIKDTLHKYCENNGFAFLSRIKTLESVFEKIETGRFTNWNSLDDLFACSIIIPNLSYEPRVINFIESIFPSDKIISRISKMKAPEVFRFDTTRYLSHIEIGNNNSLNFEIQIRTVFEHAWISTTHDLVYKFKKVDWKRLRLAAELKANLELLDNIILAFEQNVYLRTDNYWPEIKCKNKIQDFMEECFNNKLLPDEFMPDDYSRFINTIWLFIEIHPNFNDKRITTLTDETINILRNEFVSLINEYFPRTISLLQLIFGLLIKNNRIDLDQMKLIPLITPDLESIFPQTKNIRNRFDLAF